MDPLSLISLFVLFCFGFYLSQKPCVSPTGDTQKALRTFTRCGPENGGSPWYTYSGLIDVPSSSSEPEERTLENFSSRNNVQSEGPFIKVFVTQPSRHECVVCEISVYPTFEQHMVNLYLRYSLDKSCNSSNRLPLRETLRTRRREIVFR